ncbi:MULTISPECIES: ABC transporter permease [Paenibacillus]|uniref:ABC transporter permease n=1 Tax=Paenibacillus campinasensis TaxID=66347 RepID=A0A268EJZ9_9BACL|nr:MULTISPECIES: ABC transporter permease [Paenibacillus]PAD73404.1 ABC transporter permease [Paenibacillus campinasensis]PAK51194.1 ABC transporter permease [Paenibacillus sp. 7541]
MKLTLLHAEGLKLKRLCRLIPLIQGIILISMTALEWYLYFRQGPGGVYAGFAVMYMFLSFVFLLGITLLASIMAGTEHETRAWKQLLAMPVPKGSIYLAKLVWIFLLQLCTVVITVVGMCVIWVLYTNEPIPWKIMILQPLFVCLSSVPMMAIQLWLSTVFANQALPLALGIFGSVSSLFLARSSSPVIHLLPWSYPALSSPLIPGHMQWIGISLGVGLMLSILGTLMFTRREFE